MGSGMQLRDRLRGVAGIAIALLVGFSTYPPVVAFACIACVADEYYCVLQQLITNVDTYSEPGTPAHRPAKLCHKRRAAFVMSSVIIGVGGAASLSTLCAATLLVSVCWVSFLLFVDVERSSLPSAIAEQLKKRQEMDGAQASQKQSNGTSAKAVLLTSTVDVVCAPPRPDLLLHGTPLHSAHIMLMVLGHILGLFYAGFLLGHAPLILFYHDAHESALRSLLGDGIVGALLHVLSKKTAKAGLVRILYVIAVTAAGENGAMVVGRTLGRHKLCVRTSPKKTVEGLVGQLVASALAAALLAQWAMLSCTMTHALLVGVWLGFVAAVGDLFESLLKRSIGVKDAGKVIPGVGGVLDRVDGLVFAFPAFYYVIPLLHT